MARIVSIGTKLKFPELWRGTCGTCGSVIETTKDELTNSVDYGPQRDPFDEPSSLFECLHCGKNMYLIKYKDTDSYNTATYFNKEDNSQEWVPEQR